MTYKTITDFIGKTPLIELPSYSKETGVTVLGKCEFMNPFSSVKDRTSQALITAAEQQGVLKPGATIIEATSGNTGIGLAFVGVAKGYRVILTMPESMTLERRRMLKALGAEIVLTPAHLGMSGAIEKANELVATMQHVFVPTQFDNPANPAIHYDTTAPEIDAATNGEVDVVVGGVGTGGTIAGLGRYFQEKKPAVEIVAVEPAASPVLSGGEPGPHMLQGIGAGFVPPNIKPSDYTTLLQVSNEDAFAATRALAKREGVLCGMSSGANLHALLTLARQPQYAGKTMVCILCDFGERYLSTTLFDQEAS